MALYDEGVTLESPTGPEGQTDGASSAGTQNTGLPAPSPTESTVPYSRFHEVNTGFRNAEARAAAAEQAAQLHQQELQATRQQLQQLQGQLQQRAAQPSRTREEEQERQLAVKTLRELQSEDPDYARMQRLAQVGPELIRKVFALEERLARNDASTAQGFARGEEGRLQQMATAAGITIQTPQQFAALNNYVAGIIRSDPNAHAAFQQGDQTVMPWALERARQEYAATQQPARAAVAQTKTLTGKLPPRLGGGVPGSVAPVTPKFDPANPGSREAGIFKNMRTSLAASLAERAAAQG